MVARRKKSGRITLRMDPDVHARVEKTAKPLGMDINGLLNLIIREGLIRYEVEARMLQRPETLNLFEQWRKLNPNRLTPEFFLDCTTISLGGPVRFETSGPGERYMFNEDETAFIEAPPGWPV